MSDIKAGDLVMVIKPIPCCNTVRRVGYVFTVRRYVVGNGRCRVCGAVRASQFAEDDSTGLWFELRRIKKIDPPAEGDSLPTRADLEVTA